MTSGRANFDKNFVVLVTFGQYLCVRVFVCFWFLVSWLVARFLLFENATLLPEVLKKNAQTNKLIKLLIEIPNQTGKNSCFTTNLRFLNTLYAPPFFSFSMECTFTMSVLQFTWHSWDGQKFCREQIAHLRYGSKERDRESKNKKVGIIFLHIMYAFQLLAHSLWTFTETFLFREKKCI